MKLMSHHLLLQSILDGIKQVDFHKLGKWESSHVITKTESRILVIHSLLRIVRETNLGLAQSHGEIYLYNGAFWSRIDSDEFKDFLGKCSSKMGVKWSASKDYQFKDQLLKQFLSEANLPQINDLTNDNVKINLLNGTYHVNGSKSQLQSFKASEFIRYQLPFKFNTKSVCPVFEKFLNNVLPDQQSQDVLAEFIASAFIGNKVLKLEKAMILFGSGANGKSVVFEIISALLGSTNVSTYSLSSLTSENGYYRAQLNGKLLNYASELHGRMNSNMFKQLASGEPIEARSPFGRPYILTNYCKFMFNCNELPNEVEHTTAFFRRFLILPFNVTIPESKQDKALASKIIDSELSGIFNWVLRGLKRLLKNKSYTICQASIDKVNDYKKQSNSIALFIDDMEYKTSQTDIIMLKSVYADYVIYCKENNYRPTPNNKFSNGLKTLGFECDRNSSGTFVFANRSVSNMIAQLTQPTL